MKNRWIVLIAGIIIQTILGGIYAWSLFSPLLEQTYNLSKGQCANIFGVGVAVFTLAMIPGGRILTRRGPRFTALIGAVLYMSGYLVASKSGGAYPLLLLGISGLAGAGIGFGYVCPLTVGMKWFPNHKGLITGVAVAGFGGGAIILSAIAGKLLAQGMDVLEFFKYIGFVAGGLLILASLLLDVPDEAPITATKPTVAANGRVRSMPFLLCLLGIFIGTFAGLLVIGNLTPIALGGGLSYEQAATGVSAFAIGNALGRILWGFLFDRVHYKTIPASLGILAMLLALLFLAGQYPVFLTASVLIGFGFSANFVIYASALSRHFGIDAFPRLYPLCFLGYGLAGLTSPMIGGTIADFTGSYDNSIFLSIALLVAATAITQLGLPLLQGDEDVVENEAGTPSTSLD